MANQVGIWVGNLEKRQSAFPQQFAQMKQWQSNAERNFRREYPVGRICRIARMSSSLEIKSLKRNYRQRKPDIVIDSLIILFTVIAKILWRVSKCDWRGIWSAPRNVPRKAYSPGDHNPVVNQPHAPAQDPVNTKYRETNGQTSSEPPDFAARNQVVDTFSAVM